MSPTLSVRDDCPAINVKDRHVWARDSRLARAYADLGEQTIAAIYDGIQADFWQDIAPDIAEEHGYDRGDIGQTGHSGGWLIVNGQLWPDHVDFDSRIPFDFAEGWHDGLDEPEIRTAIAERDRFMRFADAIDGAVRAAGEMFVQRCLEAVRELDAARENAIVKGEN